MSVNFSVCIRSNSLPEQESCKLAPGYVVSLQSPGKLTIEATGSPKVLAVAVSPVSLLVPLFIFSLQGPQHSPHKLFSIKHVNAYQSKQKSLTVDSVKHIYQKILFEKHYAVNLAPD